MFSKPLKLPNKDESIVAAAMLQKIKRSKYASAAAAAAQQH